MKYFEQHIYFSGRFWVDTIATLGVRKLFQSYLDYEFMLNQLRKSLLFYSWEPLYFTYEPIRSSSFECYYVFTFVL